MLNYIIIILPILFLLWMAAGYFSSLYLTYPAHTILKNPTTPAGKQLQKVTILTDDSIKISAWYAGNNSKKAVILLAGIGGNRLDNFERGKIYIKQGYSVLLPDLRGTGMSGGGIISFGWNERKDLEACYAFLKKKGYTSIAAHGCSLGAATITYSLQDSVPYNFIVLESCYDNIDNAFKNRTAHYYLPDIAYWPIRFFITKRINAGLSELKPEHYIKQAYCPVLMIAGDSEEQIKLSETEKLYNNCPSATKELYIFKGGKHEDFYKKYTTEYDSVLTDFIKRF